MTAQAPKLSADALKWDKLFPTPKKTRSSSKASDIEPYRENLCAECGSRQVADEAEGQLVCTACGLCERQILRDFHSYDDVDWQQQTVVSKSEHVPITYCINLMKKYNLQVTEELIARYKAVLFWSERCQPAGRKSYPS